MVVLGPDIVRHGVDPDTAVICFGDGMVLLGPAEGPSSEVDPIAQFFVVLGKIIAARRVATSDLIVDPRPPAAIETFGALQSVVLGFADDDAVDVVWRPLAQGIQRNAIEPLTAHVSELDQRTRRFVASETQAVLAIDPRASVEQRLEALDAYLQSKGLTIEQSHGGFRDFLATAFKDTQGRSMVLPSSTDPSFPDSWITPTPIDPTEHGGSRRQWNIIW